MLTPLRRRVPKKSPDRYHHGDLERAMLEAALVLIERRGLTGWTMREAARLAGVSPGAPYRHFADKQQLLATLAERGFLELARQMDLAQHEAGDDPLLRLRALGRTQACFAQRHPSYYRAMFGPHELEERKYPALHAAAMRTFSRVLTAVERCQAAGILRDWEPIELAILGWAMNHGVSDLALNGHLERAGYPRDAIGSLPERLGRLMFEGVGPESLPRLPRQPIPRAADAEPCGVARRRVANH
jgi:AcrR family transcriptional regulator